MLYKYENIKFQSKRDLSITIVDFSEEDSSFKWKGNFNRNS